MKSNQESIFNQIIVERRRQDLKFDEQNWKPIEWIAILSEEVGEAAKEALDHHFNNRTSTGYNSTNANEDLKLKRYRKELVQVAAVAVSMLECFDRNYEF